MSLHSTSQRWTARAITLAVPIAALAGPLTGAAEAAKPARTPAPQITVKPANPTNDTTGSFAWTAVAGTTYTCGLDGAARATCAGTFHAASKLADGLHTLVIRSQATGSRASNWSYSWRVDTVAPAAPSIAPPPAQTSATSLAVTFSDSDTSVTHYTCATDGQAAAACTSPFQQAGFAEGSHTLTVTALDAAGNGASSSTHWIVDRTAPDVPVVTAPPSPTNSTSASIAFSADPTATVTCALDDAAAGSCTSPVVLAGLSEGSHRLTVAARDAAGNTASNAVQWVVDTTAPPAPAIVTGPADPTDDTSPTIQFADSDPSGVHYTCTVTDITTSVAVQGPEACSSPYVVSAATTDAHRYQLRVVPTDGAGNVGPEDISATWTVDLNVTPSPAALVAAPASPSNVTSPSFSFVAPDGGQAGGATGFLCSLDGAAYAACGSVDPTAPTSYAVTSALADGPHAFSVETTDGTNVSAPVTWQWVVDTVAPAAPQVSAPDPASVNPTILFGDSDPNVTYFCSVDGGAFVACSSPWTPPADLSNGTHTLVVASADAAGNQTAAAPVSFTVQQSPVTQSGGAADTTAPVVDSLAAPKTLTAPAVLSFSEPVLGLTNAAVRLTVAGASGAVGTSVACLSNASAVVACAGQFQKLRLTPTSSLVAGQRYTITLATGATHDLGGNPSAATSRAFRAALTVEENNGVLRSAWPTVAATAAYGHSYVREHLAGASASWVFTGTSVTWWTVTGPSFGKAAVYVDGVRKATFDNYAIATHYRVARAVKGLSKARHTVTIRVLGVKGATAGKGTFVAVDGFTVGATRTVTPALTVAMRQLSSTHFRAGHARVMDLNGESVTLTFRGTSITWLTERATNQGRAAIYVDGVRMLVVDNYAAATSYGVKRTISKLADKVHTVKIVALGTHHKGGKGNQVTTDGFTVG